MTMTNNPVNEIKSRIDIVEELGKHITLEKSGARYIGFCPFHGNVNTPALTVYPEQQSWWCYGCNKGGDIFNFLSEFEEKDFSTLVKEFANRLGIILRKLSPKEQLRVEYHEHLYAILKRAAQLFHTHLMWSSEANGARIYLQHRGITSKTMEDFQLGYAPDSWDWLYLQLKQDGFDEKLIVTAGLAKPRRNTEGYYDYFRHRIMFPIHANGEIMGFGGRAMNESNGAKYINSPNTPIFSKRKTVYGLVRAGQAIKERKSACVVEGYMDVLALHQAGFTNTVSIMGVSLTNQQAKLLSKHTRRITLALDPDEAAETAIARLLTERYSDLDLYIAKIPGKHDPDELVLEDPELWQEILAAARPIPIYMTDYLIGKHAPSDAKERRNVARLVMPLINVVKDPFEQTAYQEYLAKALGYKKYRPNPTCPHCNKKYYGETDGT